MGQSTDRDRVKAFCCRVCKERSPGDCDHENDPHGQALAACSEEFDLVEAYGVVERGRVLDETEKAIEASRAPNAPNYNAGLDTAAAVVRSLKTPPTACAKCGQPAMGRLKGGVPVCQGCFRVMPAITELFSLDDPPGVKGEVA